MRCLRDLAAVGCVALLVLSTGTSDAPAAQTASAVDPLDFLTAERHFDPEAWIRAGGEGPLELPDDVRFDPGCLTPLGPRRAAAPGDENWYAGFGAGVLDGAVRAIVPFQDGHAIGGDFLGDGAVTLNSVAVSVGGSFVPLGPGFDARVRVLLLHDGQLHAAGEFTASGGAPLSFVARWDGAAWQPLGAGLDGHVHALHSHDGQLWAGGEFPGHVAVWDGATWSVPGGGAGSWVRAFAVHDGLLHVGGDFLEIGGTPVRRVARWTGSAWEPVGAGTNAPVFTLASYGGDLIAGGIFTVAGVTPALRIALWDGLGWRDLGFGLNDFVWTLFAQVGELAIGGNFTATTDGSSNERSAAWDGFDLRQIGDGLDGTVWAIAPRGDALLAGGAFAFSGARPVSWLAATAGDAWASLGDPLQGWAVRGTLDRNGDVWVYGQFESAGGIPVQNLVRWSDGWAPTPNGHGLFAIHDLLEEGPQMFAAGRGQELHAYACVRRLDGSAWTAVGGLFETNSGLPPVARDLQLYQGELYVAGRFKEIRNVPISGIARWDGNDWQPVGGGLDLGFGESAWSLAVYDGRLVVAGDFEAAGGVPASRIAAWDGTEWSALGAGFTSRVRVLHVHEGDLIAGGLFNSASFPPLSRIARWDGTRWRPIGLGLQGRVRALASLGSDLIAGGSFEEIPNGVMANNIARFDGVAWSALGSGMDDRVIGLRTTDQEIWVGGRFEVAGAAASRLIARWIEPGAPGSGDPVSAPRIAIGQPVRAYPNPGAGPVSFRLEIARDGPASLELFDVGGRRVRRLLAGPVVPGGRVVLWDGRTDDGARAPAGVYFYRFEQDGAATTGKIVRTGGTP